MRTVCAVIAVAWLVFLAIAIIDKIDDGEIIEEICACGEQR